MISDKQAILQERNYVIVSALLCHDGDDDTTINHKHEVKRGNIKPREDSDPSE